MRWGWALALLACAAGAEAAYPRRAPSPSARSPAPRPRPPSVRGGYGTTTSGGLTSTTRLTQTRAMAPHGVTYVWRRDPHSSPLFPLWLYLALSHRPSTPTPTRAAPAPPNCTQPQTAAFAGCFGNATARVNATSCDVAPADVAEAVDACMPDCTSAAANAAFAEWSANVSQPMNASCGFDVHAVLASVATEETTELVGAYVAMVVVFGLLAASLLLVVCCDIRSAMRRRAPTPRGQPRGLWAAGPAAPPVQRDEAAVTLA